ncbi:MAG: hypothetical protein LC799_22045 [Actinobacteria bacterium]|nr:hypothetical protein [Actinomycetota bacterium]
MSPPTTWEKGRRGQQGHGPRVTETQNEPVGIVFLVDAPCDALNTVVVGSAT